MLKPTVSVDNFISEAGFKRCKQPYNECAYLCVSHGCQMLFVSKVMFAINPWDDDDPRIHKHPHCRYSDKRDALDITYQLIKAGMLKSAWEG